MTRKVLLSLGSNSGESDKMLDIAVAGINTLAGAAHVTVSSRYSTAPWGKTDQADFINMCVVLDYAGDVVQLMQNILKLEENSGRTRLEKWGPRVIDIDIILAGETVVDLPDLQIPHPHFRDRRFVLEPAAEIAGSMIDPITGRSIRELLDICSDQSHISRK